MELLLSWEIKPNAYFLFYNNDILPFMIIAIDTALDFLGTRPEHFVI